MDLETFEKSGKSLVILKNNQIIFESSDHMLRPLVQAIKEQDLSGAIIFDKRIGRGASLLFIYAKVAQVFTLCASKHAVAGLEENNIPFTAKAIVDNLMNTDGTKVCIMEKLSAGKSPSEFFQELTK